MPCRQKVPMIATLKNAEECGSGVAVLLLCPESWMDIVCLA